MKRFIEVTIFDNVQNNRRALLPVDNIACVEEGEGYLKIYLKRGTVDFLNVLQTFDQIGDLLNAGACSAEASA